jgi:hypothetical protein
MIRHTGEGRYPENPGLVKINEFLDASLQPHDENGWINEFLNSLASYESIRASLVWIQGWLMPWDKHSRINFRLIAQKRYIISIIWT